MGGYTEWGAESPHDANTLPTMAGTPSRKEAAQLSRDAQDRRVTDDQRLRQLAEDTLRFAEPAGLG